MGPPSLPKAEAPQGDEPPDLPFPNKKNPKFLSTAILRGAIPDEAAGTCGRVARQSGISVSFSSEPEISDYPGKYCII